MEIGRQLALIAVLSICACRLVAQPNPATNTAPASTQPAQGARLLREQQVDQAPKVEIANGLIAAVVMLPDAQKGFYRATRFDWSGMVTFVEYQGHTFFGGRLGPDGQTQPGHTLGTSDEFKVSLPVYPNGAATQPVEPGQKPPEPVRQIRIGVGVLEPRLEQRGRTTRTVWQLVRPFEWRVETGADFVEFRQEAGEGPWGYSYAKRVQLSPNAPAMTITRHLVNTGQEPIECMHYCHNWLRIDGQHVGRQYRLTFPFEPHPQGELTDKAKAQHAEAIRGRTIRPNGRFWAVLGPQERVEDNDVLVENVATGAAVRMTGSWKPDAFNIYVQPGECCPEPFIALKLAPGQERRWSSTYTFMLVAKEPTAAQPSPEREPASVPAAP